MCVPYTSHTQVSISEVTLFCSFGLFTCLHYVKQILNAGRQVPSTLIFLFKIALLVSAFCFFLWILGSAYQVPQKAIMEFLWEFALDLRLMGENWLLRLSVCEHSFSDYLTHPSVVFYHFLHKRLSHLLLDLYLGNL